MLLVPYDTKVRITGSEMPVTTVQKNLKWLKKKTEKLHFSILLYIKTAHGGKFRFKLEDRQKGLYTGPCYIELHKLRARGKIKKHGSQVYIFMKKNNVLIA